MELIVQYSIKNNPNYTKFLRENSYWYRYLNRNSLYFKSFDEEMKKAYKMTATDKLERFRKSVDKISQIIDIFS